MNRILRDFVKVSKPKKATVTGEFNVRGGMKSVIEATYPPPEEGKVMAEAKRVLFLSAPATPSGARWPKDS